MNGMMAFPLLLPILFFFFSTISALPANTTFQFQFQPAGNEREKHALLTFKSALIDRANRLSSWSPHVDCCSWNGVRCHNVTGRVIELHLQGLSLGGKVSPALLRLEFLNYLDLSQNDFGGVPIPSFLGSMRSLMYLDLSEASFGGLIPPNLGNLSNLICLNLGDVYTSTSESKSLPSLYVDNFDWIFGLSSLEFLVMADVDHHKEARWLELVSTLPSLSFLYLFSCELDNMIPSLKYVNFTSLIDLDLRYNHFNHEIPNWLFNLNTSLSLLILWGNSLKGLIPNRIGELHHLIGLFLIDNQLIGQLPEGLGQLPNLQGLYLDHNALDGPIPSSLGNLSSLQDLSLDGNRLNGTFPSNILRLLPNLERLLIGNNSLLEGTVSKGHLKKLSKLKELDMSLTSLVLKVKSNWVPPFQLELLSMWSCQMGPDFPRRLQTQTSLRYLDISNSGIRGVAPTWLWEWASRVFQIDLSNNQISGNLSGVLINSSAFRLNSNCFTGPLPELSPNAILLNMANNSFSGDISQFLCQNLNGTSRLEALDLSNNDLYGQLSHDHCWKSWPSLTHLNLGNNSLSGVIPDSISSLSSLKALHLQNNFSGSLPSSLRNCTSLGLMDLSDNQLLGNIPNWVAELTSLKALCLRSNKFIGEIPSQICQLSSLIILDVSDNELQGTIPRCFYNFSLMVKVETSDDLLADLEFSRFDLESLELMTVGRQLEYNGILKYVRMIDLSRNNFSGTIPSELSQLVGLRFMNLSHNHLMGSIPGKIGRMTSLLTLDLSTNHLSGEIPQSMASLTFLNHLNLSYNQLQGRIPLSTQLQSFDAFSYIGNDQLCGAPLTETCTEDEGESLSSVDGSNNEDDGDDDEMRWLYIGIGCGFAVGFWGVCGSLIFNKNWRYAYFWFVHGMGVIERTPQKLLEINHPELTP